MRGAHVLSVFRFCCVLRFLLALLLLLVNIPVGIAVNVTTRSNKAKVVIIPIRALTSELLELE